MGGQLHQKLLLMLEGFGRNQPRLGHRPMLDADGRPLEGLLVHIFQAFKMAARQKVRLHGPKAAFLAGFAVGVILFMTNEAESILPAEGFHLGHDHRILARPSQTRQIRVVDNADGRGVPPKLQSLIEEALHPETVEHAIKPQVPPLRVA